MLHEATVDILFGTERKVYNNYIITFLSVYYPLPSPSVIMCCSSHLFAVRAATHYHTRLGKRYYMEKNVLSSYCIL